MAPAREGYVPGPAHPLAEARGALHAARTEHESQAQDAAARAADEQRTLVERSAADYLRRSNPLERARQWRDREPGYDRAVWHELAGLGWTSLLVPESDGGLGLGLDTMVSIARAVAAAAMPEPLGETLAATQSIVHSPAGPLRSRLLDAVVAGDCIPALAFQEQAGELDAPAVDTIATAAPAAGWIVSGRKRFVAAGVGADGYVVSAMARGIPLLLWCPAGSRGVSVRARRLADGRFMADLNFSGVELSADHLLAEGTAAANALSLAIDTALIACAGELIGLSQRALDLTLDYLRTRTQFDRPIGAFQALQHRAVDLYIHQRIALSACRQVLGTLAAGAGPEQRSRLASRLKARAACSARHITREAIQLHGAIGFTDDCEVGMHVRRALVLSAWLGSEQWHRRRYMRLGGAAIA